MATEVLEQELRLELITLAQKEHKEIGGNLSPLTTEEVVQKARAYYDFVTGKTNG